MRPDQVEITFELESRPARPPDYESQKRAAGELARFARERPDELLPGFVAPGAGGADSAGISLCEPAEKSAGVFRWHYLSGLHAPFNGATTLGISAHAGSVLTGADRF